MKLRNALREPRQKRSRERVTRILDATRDILKSDGIGALSTNSIAARADIPVSSIYQYFPNKEAILLGLYEDYLEDIRAVYREIDTEENRALPWREFFHLLLDKLASAESRDNLDLEFEAALGLYPELLEADRRHEEWVANRLVDTFTQLGARWRPAKLKRLAHYLYQTNSTVWMYRGRHNPPKNEILEWHQAAFYAVAEKCFE